MTIAMTPTAKVTMATSMSRDGNVAPKLPDKKAPQAPRQRQASVPARAPADPVFLSAIAVRVGCAISPCPPIPQALQPPLRTTSLPDPSESRRCETNPALAIAPGEPLPAFPSSRTAPAAMPPNPSNPARDSCLLLPHQSKFAAGDAASTSGDDSGPDEPRCDTATSSTNCLAGTRVSREKRAGKLPVSRRRRPLNPTDMP